MHHELPERLDIDWYRARAKELLLEYRAGDQQIRQRVQASIGQRPELKLADAQHIIALEHGFTRWADFRRWIETRALEAAVGRIGRAPVSTYERRVHELVEQVRSSDADALRRVRFHVPRLAHFAEAELELRDARIVVAREYGFPTWRDLVFHVEKAMREYEHRPHGQLGEAFERIRGGDVDGLRRMLDAEPELVRATYAGAASTMLEAIAQPDVFGEHLEIELGVDPRIVQLLIERGSDLDGPLNLAACFNRAELVKVLLDGGAQPGISSPIWGITPLQAAIYHGSREAGDLLAARAVVPDALYVAAASGRHEHMERWFDSSGTLKPEAVLLRPNLADVGWPPAPPLRDEPQDVLNEAFALSAYNGRLEPMQRLLDRGADVDGAAHLGMTGLHFVVIRQRVDVARWLVEHGADISRTDGIHHGTPLGWAERIAKGGAVYDYLQALTGRSG
jgi:hypothetical protein